MLNKLVRFVKGYVDFTAVGKFPERFLNITSRRGINLWNTQPIPNGLSASMSVNDYKNIRMIARKARVQLSINKKYGLPFLVEKYKLRAGIPVGGLVGIILIIILSNFVWSVSITGAENISDTYIKSVLADNGVSVGALKNSINAKSVERNTMLSIDEIGWMSVNITGNVVSVEVKEKALKPEIDENTNPSNLKAKTDGVITKINVRSGVTEVTKGSGVTKGDLLVSGIAESTKEDIDIIRYLRASGEIFADVNYEKTLSIPLQYDYYSLTQKMTSRNELSFLWLKLPITISFDSYNNFTRSVSENSLLINNTVLPISVISQNDYELELSKITLDDDKVKRIFENQSALYEAFECSDKTIVKRDIQITHSDVCYDCKVDYIFNENIAENIDFSVTD